MHGYDEAHGFQTRLIFDPVSRQFRHEQVAMLEFEACDTQEHHDVHHDASRSACRGSDAS